MFFGYSKFKIGIVSSIIALMIPLYKSCSTSKQQNRGSSASLAVVSNNSFGVVGNSNANCSLSVYGGNTTNLPNSTLVNGKDSILLCYDGFANMYKNSLKIPIYSSEILTMENVSNGDNLKRLDKFSVDDRIEKLFGSSPTHNDYYSGGVYDRGHLTPKRDMDNTNKVYESFLTTNIFPQYNTNNRGVWAKIETQTRNIATKEKQIFVVTIPIIDWVKRTVDGKVRISTLNYNKKNWKGIAIPDYIAKAIYVPSRNCSFVYFTKNADRPYEYSIITVNQLREISYIDPFPFIANKDSVCPRSIMRLRRSDMKVVEMDAIR